MPIGSPGMEGPNPQAYSVLAVQKDDKLGRRASAVSIASLA
jgi:hypothetical protein